MAFNLRNVAAWISVIILAWTFISSGIPKMTSGSGEWINRFSDWGFQHQFVRLIGITEIISGILILIPSASVIGAAIMAIVMIGAIYTHLNTAIGSPGLAMLYLGLCILVILLRWKETIFLQKDG